jgi:hypothetical protein
MVIIGAPKEIDRMPSAVIATSQERRVSSEPAVAARPVTDALVMALQSQRRGPNRAAMARSLLGRSALGRLKAQRHHSSRTAVLSSSDGECCAACRTRQQGWLQWRSDSGA